MCKSIERTGIQCMLIGSAELGTCIKICRAQMQAHLLPVINESYGLDTMSSIQFYTEGAKDEDSHGIYFSQPSLPAGSCPS